MENNLILRAAVYAAEAHELQKRKNSEQPYINHLLRVAEQASLAGLSDEAIAAALLHDVVEDTSVPLDAIRSRFSERVTELVRLLTKWWPDDAPQELKATEKPKYYGAILRNPEAVNIKLLDRADNLRDMARLLPKTQRWAERYVKKTVEEVTPVLEASDNAQVRRIYLEALQCLQDALGR